MGATLAITDVTKAFGPTEVLRQIAFDVHAGSFVSLLGPSGCGKSTLLRIIAGFEAQDHGTVSIGGKVVDHLAPRARNLAMVFQSYALYPHMSVAENISLPLEMERLSTLQRLPLVGRFISGQREQMAAIAAQVQETAALVEIDHLLDRRPAQLSGGQRQRVALARAMVRAPGLFLMDEPLSNLDAKLRVAMRAELVSLNKRLDATILYVTHDQIEAMTMSDHIALMMHGRVLQYATPEELYTSPSHIDVATFIGQPAINCLPARAQNGLYVQEAEKISLNVSQNSDDLTLAIRPEALVLRSEPTSTAQISIPVTLDRVELLGAEVLLWCSSKHTGRTLVAQARAAEHREMLERGVFAGSLWLEADDGPGVHVFDAKGEVVGTINCRVEDAGVSLAVVS